MSRVYCCLAALLLTLASCDDATAPSAVPKAPDNVLTKVRVGEIEISWRDIASNESFYLVEVSVDGGPFLTLANAASNTSHTKYTDPEAGKEFRFRVSACNRAGCSEPVEVGASTAAWIKPLIQRVDAAPAGTGTAVVYVNANSYGHEASITVLMYNSDNSSRVLRGELIAGGEGAEGQIRQSYYFPNLVPGETYRYFATVTTRYGTSQSEQRTFVAADFTLPMVADAVARDITSTSVTVAARVHPGGTESNVYISVAIRDTAYYRTVVRDVIPGESTSGERRLRPIAYTIPELRPNTAYTLYLSLSNRGGSANSGTIHFLTLPQ